MIRAAGVDAERGGPFCLLPGEEQALAPRREVKFVLPLADLGKLRSILETNCRRVTYNQPASLVSSVYFDSPGLLGYYDSIEGNGRRWKVRLRWYDDGDGRFFLEIKRRANGVVLKERFAVQSRVSLRSLTFREIVRELSRVLPVGPRETLLHRPYPVLMTEYTREYFATTDDRFRITVDFELSWFDQSWRLKPTKTFAVRLPQLLILEVKTGPSSESELPRLLYPLRLRATRASKYVIGCQQIGVVSDTRGSLF